MQIVRTERAPLPIGPYSQAVRAGDFIFISGQVGVDPKTKALVLGGIEAQTRQALENKVDSRRFGLIPRRSCQSDGFPRRHEGFQEDERCLQYVFQNEPSSSDHCSGKTAPSKCGRRNRCHSTFSIEPDLTGANFITKCASS